MPTIHEALRRAVDLHRAGQGLEAETLCRQILALTPDQPDALHLLGVVAQQRGDSGQATALLGRAASSSPSAVDIHLNLAFAFQAQGQIDKTIATLRHVCTLQPGHALARRCLDDALALRRRRWTFRITDPSLKGTFGHFLNENIAFAEEARRRGYQASVLCNRACHPDIVRDLSALPLFSYSMFDNFSSHPLWNDFESFMAIAPAMAQDFARLGPEYRSSDNVFLFHTANHFILQAIGTSLLQGRGDGPRVVYYAGFDPGLEFDDNGHPQIRSGAVTLYRLAMRAIPPWNRKRLILVSSSPGIARKYETIFEQPVTVLPVHRCLPEGFVPGPLRSRHDGTVQMLLYQGDARPDKGFDLVPDVAERLLARYPQVVLHVQISGFAGTPKMRPAAERLVAMAQQHPRLRVYMGFLKREAYYQIIDGSDLVVLPYHGLNYIDHTSGLFFEAAACGKPMVCPEVGSMKRFMDQGRVCGSSFAQHSAEAIVEAVARSLGTLDALAPRAQALGTAWRAEHSIENAFEKILALLDASA